jgi:hypothetical protein
MRHHRGDLADGFKSLGPHGDFAQPLLLFQFGTDQHIDDNG